MTRSRPGACRGMRCGWVLADLVTFSPAYFSSVGARPSWLVIVHDESLHVSERIKCDPQPGSAARRLYPGHGPSCMLCSGGLRSAPVGNTCESGAA